MINRKAFAAAVTTVLQLVGAQPVAKAGVFTPLIRGQSGALAKTWGGTQPGPCLPNPIQTLRVLLALPCLRLLNNFTVTTLLAFYL